MRRIISITAALVILLSVDLSGMSANVFAADSDQAYEIEGNILNDGGFELANQMWTLTEGFSTDESTVKSGFRSLKVTPGATENKVYSPAATATSESYFRVGMWIKTLELSPLGALTVGLDADGETVASKSIDGTLDWQYIELTTEKTLSGTLRMFVETKAGASGTAWIDDVTICPLKAMIYEPDKSEEEIEKSLFADIGESENAEAIETVYSLGFMESETPGSFVPQGRVTRGNFAEMILKLAGFDLSTADSLEKTRYSDVVRDSEFYDSVMYVSGLGYMQGNDDGTFRPLDNITLNQALKVFVKMLNRDAQADNKGGYPTGYFYIAKTAGLLKGVSNIANDEAVSRETMAQLMYNLLEADAYEQTAYTSEGYVDLRGYVTYSELYLNIKIGTGVIDANEYTGLYSVDGTAEGKVSIDGREYYANTNNAKDYLGYRVKYYAKISNNDSDILLYISVKTEKNKKLVLDDENIQNAELSEDRTFTITYINEDDRTKKARVELNASVIFNGVYCKAPASVDFMPKAGSVTLLDSDGNGDYNTVFVKSAIAYRTSSVSVSRKFITDANGKPQLNLNDDKLIIKKEGKEISLSHILKDDMLYVYRSKGNRNVLTSIEVYNSKKSGYISMATGNGEAVIGSYRYRISDILFLKAKTNDNGEIVYENESYSQLKVGDSGTAYIDKKGRIVDFDFETFKGERYGYIVAKAEIFDGLETSAIFRILDEDGSFYDYETADKPELDGQKVTTADLLNSTFLIRTTSGFGTNPLFNDGEFKEQLVRYKINSSGRIASIDTTLRGINEDDRTLKLASITKKRYYSSYSKTLSITDEIYTPEADVKVFSVSQGAYNMDKESDYSVSGSNIFNGEHEYDLAIYDADKFNRVKAMVMSKTSEENMLVEASLMLVTNIGTAIDENGNECVMFEGMTNGALKQIYARDEMLSSQSNRVEEIKKGDIIRWSASGSNMLRVLNRVRNVREDSFGRNYTLYYSNNLLVFGRVIDVDGAYVMLDLSTNGDGSIPLLFVCSNSSAYFYEYDRKRSDAAYMADLTDIAKGDYLFLRTRNTNLLDAIIVKN